MSCGRCGNANDEGFRFCISCGAPLTAPAQGAPESAAPAQAVPGPAAPAAASPAPVVPESASPAPVVPESAAPASMEAPTMMMPPVQPQHYPGQASGPGFGPVPGQVSGQSAGRHGKGRIAIIIAAVLVVVALVIAGVTLATRNNPSDGGTSAPQGPSSSNGQTIPDDESDDRDTEASEEQEPDDKEQGLSARTLDQESTDRIVDAFSTTDVAVSVMTEDGLRSYSSSNASTMMVSAGLYLPVYLAYYDAHEGQPSDSAGEMMRSMDNEAANLVIDSLGGVDAVDSWLSDNQYTTSRFERKYGDVAASENGYENYASSDDAARMLSQIAADGADELMSFDIASEGVDVPEGATVHAHRGMGIQDSYNYFVVISDGRSKVGVAVMTEGMGQEQAADLTSQMLATVWDTMFEGTDQ